MKQKLITLYIGMLDKDTHKKEHSIEYFKRQLDVEFNYYTLIQCEGRYTHEDGTIVNEPSLKVEISIPNDFEFDLSAITRLKEFCNQECIMVTTQELNVEFI